MFFKSAAPFAVALAVLASAPAAVQAAGFDQTSVKVSYADLNLSTEEGQSLLQDRIKYAASTVCGGNEVHRGLGEERTYDACRADTVADGLAQVHKAAVSISTVAMK
jgi:UrcA family protein